jgi:hypothetical protein
MTDIDLEITCVSREMVGALATVTATIYEPLGTMKRVKDVIVVTIENGNNMDDETLIDRVKEEYANASV